jgi:hypothetical protein
MLFWPLSSDVNACRRVQHLLRETGSVISTVVMKAGRPRTVRTPANEDATFVSVEQEPLKASAISHVCPWIISWRSSLWIQLCEWLLHQRAVDVLWLHSILWVDESVFCMRVCSTVISGRRAYLLRKSVYQFNFIVSVWAGIVGDIVFGPFCYQTDSRFKDVVIFGRLFTDAASWSCACSCEAEVGVSTWRSCSRNGEDIWQLVNATYSQRWTGGRGIFNRFLSPDINPMDFSCGETWWRTFTQFFPWLLEICWQEFRQMWRMLMPEY